MCLILFAWQVHPDFPLVLAGNRDEFYSRPSQPLERWPDFPKIIGGKDLKAGGSWLACHEDGRFAAVTNVRQGLAETGFSSRGEILINYLKSNLQPNEFIEKINPESYGGFNLLLGSWEALYYISNRNGVLPQKLVPGLYGLSNHRLDTPWPKVASAKKAFKEALLSLPCPEPFFKALSDKKLAQEGDLPETGIPLETERLLSAVFIASADYGTCSSSLLRVHRGGSFCLLERRFGANGVFLGENSVFSGADPECCLI